MLNPKQIEETVLKITQAIPNGFGQTPDNFKSQVKAILTASFEKMDLVSREEFDIQMAVLAKTRAKLEALEEKVAELEQAHLTDK
ncbi:accessory factor UbiK family protein [Thiomicrorhabdus sp. ZW0627]|uniref:accessory factor UbiK family protein n=1 Tax=Thiomicrorhabdus sp. ZW0627 TaxID=3039774 RepID=UPI0024369729|nr:accessory factor UbiK family protein [Thiomicrorhabdus sp. ZW0627]MDG6774476.1 accessory factor UbiK family protein [Thiomicrorhabdus sp. ZW0627]